VPALGDTTGRTLGCELLLKEELLLYEHLLLKHELVIQVLLLLRSEGRLTWGSTSER
jgi:hypothetical protein